MGKFLILLLSAILLFESYWVSTLGEEEVFLLFFLLYLYEALN